MRGRIKGEGERIVFLLEGRFDSTIEEKAGQGVQLTDYASLM